MCASQTVSQSHPSLFSMPVAILPSLMNLILGRMNAVLKPLYCFLIYVVADLSLAAWGRKGESRRESEMPGLMAIRRDSPPPNPLKGARIYSLHMTIRWRQSMTWVPTDADLATLLDARPRGRRHCDNTRVRHQGENPGHSPGLHPPHFYQGLFSAKDRRRPEHDSDDGDVTLMLHLGTRAETDALLVANPGSGEEICLFNAIRPNSPFDPTGTPPEKHHRRDRRDHHRRAALNEMSARGAGVPRHQRER
jgi:adenosylhomocysteinase